MFDGPRDLVSWMYPEVGDSIPHEYYNEDIQKFIRKRKWPQKVVYKKEEFFDLHVTPFNHHSLQLTKLNIQHYPVPDVDLVNFYKINSMGFRSDEFTDKHDGQHILFAGCSMTFGDGIPLQYLWAHKLYSKIKAEHGASGYFNIASNGASVGVIIENTYKYIKKYGKPDYVFMLLPDLQRTMNSYAEDDRDQGFREQLSLYLALSDLCIAYGINLIVMSWEISVNIKKDVIENYKFYSQGEVKNAWYLPEYRDTIPQFHKLDFPEYKDEVRRYVADNFDTHEAGLFLDLAWDDAHPGIAEHEFWYNKFYEKYMDIHSQMDKVADL